MSAIVRIIPKKRVFSYLEFCFAFIFICFLSVTASAQGNSKPSDKLKVRFIDSNTGFAVYPEEVVIKDKVKKEPLYNKKFSKEEAKKEFDKGVLPSSVTFEPSDYEYIIKSSGYKPMTAHFDLSAGQLESIEFHLEPIERPAELAASALLSLKNEESSVKAGFVVDDDTGLPLAGVQVSTADGQSSTWTNERGFFTLRIPLRESAEQFPTCNILFEKAGYQAEERDFEELKPSEVSTTRVRLVPGQGKKIIDQRKNSDKDNSETTSPTDLMSDVLKSIYEQNQPIENAYFTGSAVVNAELFLTQMVTGTYTPSIPETIRVGTNCNGTRNGCTGAEVYMLDDYVKMVLPREWVPCWGNLTGGMNALWAGAIAARTYASYMVFHPISMNLYDICDNDSCQAITEPDARTNQAVDATVGLVLVDSVGQIIFSEFSSENNNFGYRNSSNYCSGTTCRGGGETWDSCGDGYVGRKNSTKWPCIADTVSAGFTINGHGKGMSQFGSARWATGLLISPSAVCSANNPAHNYGVKTWDQILNHYYPTAQIVQGKNVLSTR